MLTEITKKAAYRCTTWWADVHGGSGCRVDKRRPQHRRQRLQLVSSEAVKRTLLGREVRTLRGYSICTALPTTAATTSTGLDYSLYVSVSYLCEDWENMAVWAGIVRLVVVIEIFIDTITFIYLWFWQQCYYAIYTIKDWQKMSQAKFHLLHSKYKYMYYISTEF